MAGIKVSSSFDRQVALPLDDSFIKADTTARDAIATGVRYDGLLVYTVADSTLWQLQGGITNAHWVEPAGSDATKANLAGGNTFTGTQNFSNDAIFAAYLKRSTALSIIANSGGGQASATVITKDINRVTTVAVAGDSVKLSSIATVIGVGASIFIQNDGVADLHVFPASGEFINELAANIAVVVKPGSNIIFFAIFTNTWKSFSGGGALPLTTKGDLLGFTTEAARLAVGADGKILKANSATTTGLEWGDAPVANVIRAGRATLASTDQTKSVTFSSALASANYALTCNFENTTDTDPFFIQHFISAKSTTGFTVKFSVPTDSANYVLNWTAIENA
jgi:hypothetical protein